MAKEVNDNKEKLKALQLTLDKIEKAYGKGTVMNQAAQPIGNMEFIPTG